MPSTQFTVHPEQSPHLGLIGGLRIREDTLFTDHKGREKSGARRRAEKGIQGLQEVLTRAVGPDEVVLHIARCQAPVPALEQLALGWYVYYVSATVLVFTNQRLLGVLVKDKGLFGGGLKWRQSLRSTKWGDIEDIKARGWPGSTLKIKYRNGKSEKYWRMRSADAKKVRVLFDAVLAAGPGEGSLAQAMVSQCPSCMAELTPQIYECARCHMVFKNERSLFWRLLVPGGAYFYVGHGFLGVMHLLGESIVLFEFAIACITALGIADLLAEPNHPTARAEAISVVGFLAILIFIEKMLTMYHCRRMVRQFLPAK